MQFKKHTSTLSISNSSTAQTLLKEDNSIQTIFIPAFVFSNDISFLIYILEINKQRSSKKIIQKKKLQ